MDFNKNIDYGCQAQLLGTIKLPRNMNEINQKLPKTKKYEEYFYNIFIILNSLYIN